MRAILRFILLSSPVFLIFNASAALPTNPWYMSLNAGVFQGNFDAQYNDLSDTIAQNIRQPVQQYGYSGGIGVGYNKVYNGQYLLGGELNGSLNTYNAYFASGSSSTAFSDQLTISRSVDLLFTPGVFITDLTAIYAKAGLSYAQVKSSLMSPTGYTPSYFYGSYVDDVIGVALGLGGKRWVGEHVAIFAEYLYHDYGKLNFPNFQNFTATYSHAVRLNTQNIVVGINYYF